MGYRAVCFSVIAVALLVGSAVRAADDDGKKGKHKGGQVAFVLSHAADLNLTDDEKTKLTALQESDKPPEGGDKEKIKEHNKEIHAKIAEILTKDQKEKLKELMGAGKKAGDKAAAAPAKEEKKDDAKDEKKDAPPPAEEKKDDGNNMGN